MKFTMTKIAAVAALALASSAAMAAPVATTGVFNMFAMKGLDQNPGNTTMTGPINVDTAVTGFIDTAAGTWGVSSTNTFFGANWTASNGTLVQAAGNYALNTTTGAVTAAAPDTVGTADGSMHFTVGAGQVAGIIDFAWGVTTGIKVVDVWNVTTSGSNQLYTAAAVPGMENGPFPGYNAQFNLTAPVPEASTYGMMLAGLGLVGFAVRRRKLVA
jgi:hypothetical protein